MLADLEGTRLTAIFCSVVVGFVFLSMSFSYTHRRASQRYAWGKSEAPSIRSFRNLSKLLFVVSMTITLLGYWTESALFLPVLEGSPIQKVMGAMIVLAGYLGLRYALNLLGDHYSPLFDAYLPQALVTTGIYRIVRHPVYLFNLFVSFGLAISSASAVVLACAFVGLLFVLKAIDMEEEYLAAHFPEYADYTKHSWRLLPLLY